VELARQAMEWYQRSIKLNPYDTSSLLGYGMCLDWIGDQGGVTEDPAPYYKRACELAPNDYVVCEDMSWHYEQTGDYAAARTWLKRAWDFEWFHNSVPQSHLNTLDQELREAAARKR